MKLSIVIPAYNIQRYISKCLDSCLNFKGVGSDNYEIIVVNDGSTDDTLSIVEDYCRRYDNLKIVTRKNGGLSAARNTGLLSAKGDYIWFVDGDDYITYNAITTILRDISNNFDMLIYCYNEILDDVQLREVKLWHKREVVNGKAEFLKCNFGFPMLVWTHVYKRDFLFRNRLFFCEGIIHEDMEYKFRSHYLAESILMSDQVIYNYRVARPGSIMNNTSSNPQRSIDSNKIIIDNLLRYCKELNVPEVVKIQYLADLSLLALERIFDQSSEIIKQNRDTVKKLCAYLWYSHKIKRKVFSMVCYCLPIRYVKLLQYYYQGKLKKQDRC